MQFDSLKYLVSGVLVASLAACGGGGSAGSAAMNPTPQSVNVPLMVSDAASEDWATVGVRILSVALIPQGGGSDVTVYTAPTPAPVTNLVQLDNLADLIGNPAVPAGTYTGAIITVSANPGDVSLIASSSPAAGFAGAAGQPIAASAIQVQGASGASGSLAVPIKVTFESPITIAAGQTTPVDLEFDLSHPAFIVGHQPPAAGGATLWAVDFDGPVRHHPVRDIAGLVLRHLYGTVTAVATDNKSFTVMKDLPTYPVVSPEVPVTTAQSLTIQADATNGTVFYDVDGRTSSTIKDFSSVATLLGTEKYVRVAARYQADGSLVAVRVWASSSFDSIWLSPEGHVRHVDTTADVITIDDENGRPVRLTVDQNTQFFVRNPGNGAADMTPVGKGTGFLSANHLVRGFKIHATPVDKTATPLVAQSVDIETAVYSGTISNPGMTQFTYTRMFPNPLDDYQVTLPYISSTTPNGKDANGTVIDGFKWWNFAYPTLADTGSGAITDFVNATGSAGVNFGGLYGNAKAFGVSYASWGDQANTSGWAANIAVLMPLNLPLGIVTSPYANGEFGMSLIGNTGGNAVTVDVSTTPGSATLVYQVDRSGGIVSVTSQDITTNGGLTALTSGLGANAAVKVWGVPEANGHLKAYVIAYFTGLLPIL